MKKLIIIICSLLLLVSGCKQKDEKIKLQFASWGSKTEVAIIREIIKDFESENPNIKIDFLHIPQNYFPKIHLLFAANTEPDIIFLNNQYLPIYANAGKLTPLENHSKGFNTKALNALSYNNTLYAIPRDISLLFIYYNKNIFNKAGISYPKAGWTQNEFLQTAIKIKEKTKNFAISFEEDPLYYLPYLTSEGADFYDLNSTEAQNALKFYAELRKKHHLAPRKEESASATMAQMFLQQHLAMHLSGRWLTPKYDNEATFEWDIIEFPAGTKGSIVPLDASGWAITNACKHKEEALIFVEYLSSQKVIQKFADTGLIIPARNDVTFKNSKLFTQILKNAIPTPVDTHYNKLLDKLKQDLEPIFN